MSNRSIQFCPYCGTRTQLKQVAGKARPTCPSCHWTYFPDPKVAVGVVVVQDNHILLVQRTGEPHAGQWALPAGFVDAYEDPEQAARRECLEETGLEVSITGLLIILAGREHARGADIMITYCANVIQGKLAAGDDAGDVRFFKLDELPPLAFETTQRAVQAWIKKIPC